MKYRLIENSLNDINNIQETVLRNRGIKNWKQYLNLGEDCTHDYRLLKNIDEAIKCFLYHIENGSNIHIVVDSDVDGYTSASMIYRYIKDYEPFANVTYSLHTQKQHGLSDDIEVPNNCDLLIIPDAGSNDVEQCKKLSENGIQIIILDHHICDIENDYAIVVNNQMCNYPNKNFCGAGIVYKFLKAVDENVWGNYADKLLDMVSLGNISDMMDMRECETRYYADLGLKRIKSKLFQALIEKQSYSMKNQVNITSVQFYITPILNALIRAGNMEDKDLMFRAFVETDEMFKYKKRGQAEEIDETIYDRVARLCVNAKARQDKEVNKGLQDIEKIICDKHIDNDKIIFVNATDMMSNTLTGLVAMKVADKYNKPCLIMKKQVESDNQIYYHGSCRNNHNSPIESLKNFLESLGLFEYVQGHDNAAGVLISRDNIPRAIKKSNEKLSNMDLSKYIYVDFEILYDDFGVSVIKTVNEMKNVFGQGVTQPLFCIKDIPVYIENAMIMGKNQNCWKITDDNGFEIVMFNADVENDVLLNELRACEGQTGFVGTLNIVGKTDISEYKGILSPQLIVTDYEFVRGEI